MSIPYYMYMKNDYNKVCEKIRQKIKLERNKRNLSQQDLSLRAELDKNTVWKIETGKASPTVKTLAKLAIALEMDFVELMDISKVEI